MTQLKFIDFIEQNNLQQKDRLFVCSHTSWNEYEAILQQKANSSAYRISFLNGVLKIMSPSRNHEIIKDFIYLLIVAYCSDSGICAPFKTFLKVPIGSSLPLCSGTIT